MSSSEGLPRAGERFDRYEVLSRVAFGGMAAVYAVRRSSIGGFDKVMAMKVMLPHLADHRDSVDMFLDEGRIAAQIEHPNVLHVFDVAEHDDTPFMIMEYVRGQSLARIAKKDDARLPLSFVVGVLQKTAEGLHAAHETCDLSGESLGIVHRDVSPHNIMVSYEGDVKVVDFGIAAARGRIASTRTGELKGKLGYVSPEAVAKSRPVDRRADVWALGVVAWEMLSGQRLFRDDDDATTLWNVMHGDVERLSSLRDDLPRPLVQCVHRCLDRDPDGRPATCAAIAEELAGVLADIDGGGRADLSALIRSKFAEEETEERTRLKSLLEGKPVAERERDEEEASALEPTDITAETQVPDASPSKWRSLFAAIVIALGGAATAALVLDRGETKVTPAAVPSETASQPSRPAATPSASASASATPTAEASSAPSSAAIPPPAVSSAPPAAPKPRLKPPRPPSGKKTFDDPY